MSTVPSSSTPTRIAASLDSATATFSEVDIRSELDTRAARAPDAERENHALTRLARCMAATPRTMLQDLVETAVDLCDADTAGISLLDGDVFRWEAVAGVFAGARDGTMPRAASPCGVCIDSDATQLMHLPDRCFPALRADPRFFEALLIPFHAHGEAVGTVWIVSHRSDRHFDSEDERVVQNLAEFASAGWQLWKASEGAAETGRRKDAFIAVLGHELRNPFAAITAAAAVLREQVTASAVSTRALDVLSRQSRHVHRLVEDLLDIERISAGKLQLDTHVFDLRIVVSEVLDTRRDQIDRRHQQVHLRLADAPVLIDADAVRIAQVMSNLIDNAAKYTPAGGEITVDVASAPDAVTISVCDTGIGIPSEQLRGIFDPCTQLRESRDLAAGGLGLGLPLVRGLVELHGGTISVESSGAGQGSLFVVRLPLAREGDTTRSSAENQLSEEVLHDAVRRATSLDHVSAIPARRSDRPLFWSRRGEVACAQHAPSPDSSAWTADGWATVALNRQGHGAKGRLQCQHCAGRPIAPGIAPGAHGAPR